MARNRNRTGAAAYRPRSSSGARPLPGGRKAQRTPPSAEGMAQALRQFDAERGYGPTLAVRPGGAGAAQGDGYGPRGEPPVGPIGKAEILQATKTLDEYRAGKANLDNRIIENEEWFKLHNALHTAEKGTAALLDRMLPMEEKADSAWLFNSLMNKHADAMDNYPEPNVLPRAADDVETARQISSVLPVVLEQNHYQSLWDSKWWYKLKHGFAATMVTWNPRALGGLGEISLRRVDVLNLAWEPGVSDIQQSRNFYSVELMDAEQVRELWPWAESVTGDAGGKVLRYRYDDTVNTSGKCSVVDWWYKKNGRLHYCKFVDDVLLFASENDPTYRDTGYYAHGLYPFVFDNMFPVEGSPCGFGYIDLMKGTQGMIDSLRRATVDHAVAASLLRWFSRDDGGVNEEEFANLSKHFVHVSGGLGENDLRPIEVPPLDGINVTMLNLLVDEMKETSGNRDFAQGGTTSGITAASAIAALQEAGSKPARDMLNASYRAFEQECELCIELMRQFYETKRYFRIQGAGGQGEEFVGFDNSGLRLQPYGGADSLAGALGLGESGRLPVFDIKVSASKKSTFSALAQNELAKELYGMGIFDPANADRALAVLGMMTFEGKDKVVEQVQRNGTLYDRVQMLQEQLIKLGYIVDATTGTLMTPSMAQAFDEQNAAGNTPAPQTKSRSTATNTLGRTVGGSDQATRARRNAMLAAAPGGGQR